MNIGLFIFELFNTLYAGANNIYSILTTPINMPSAIADFLSLIGLSSVNGITLLGLVGGTGLLAIVIYKILK